MLNAEQESLDRWWDLPAALILVVAVFLAAVRLNATNWTDELAMVQTVTLFAVLTGLALGQSNFSARTAVWFSAAYAVFTIIWLLGLTFGEGVLWQERLASLFGRLGISFGNLVRRRAVTDPIMFLFLMNVMFWILSAHAGYTLTRHANSWRATLPLGVSLFIIHIHDPFWTSRSWFLAGYIFLALLLLSRIDFLQKRQAWRRNRTHMPPFIGLDFLRTTMIIGGLLILFAWTAPAMAANFPPAQAAWQQIARPWYEARAKMTNAFASLRATVGVVQDYYGDVLPLGRGNTLTDVVLFSVEAPTRPSAGVRYYWRGRTYDTWTGTDWQTDLTEVASFRPDESSFILPNLAGRWEATFTFTALTSMPTIYSPAQPQWVSRPGTVYVTHYPDGTADINRFTVSPSIRPGEQYNATASVSDVTEAQLRAAGTTYPSFISDTYLGIPVSITRRTRELAAEIAAPFDNPYDQVEAITQWLRENITYQDTVPVPPQGRDIIDWLLFDLKQGFCNYYATAEIVMLRSLGIPARLAVGYAQGERDTETGDFTVRQRDAHAWPEVYFPGFGWIEFEPTINQRPLRRPVGDAADSQNPDGSNPSGPGSVDPRDLQELLGFEEGRTEDVPELTDDSLPENAAPLTYWGWFATGGFLIVLGSVYTWYRSRLFDPTNPLTPISVRLEKRFTRSGIASPNFLIRMARRAGMPIEARAYEQINRSLRWMGDPPEACETPAERGRALGVIIPEAGGTIRDLLRTYHLTVYCSQNGDSPVENRIEAVRTSRTLRNQTWGAIFKRFFARFQEPARRKPIV